MQRWGKADKQQRRYATLSKDNVVSLQSPEGFEDPLTELLRTGARRLIQQPIEAELAELLARYGEQVDDQGRRVVACNGYLPEREVLTTNPIESTFSMIRHRTKGCVSRNTMLAMIYKLGMSAEKRWRKIQGLNHLDKVIEDVKFKDRAEVDSETDDGKSA